ncbi:MAG TPA: hypothetical protein VKT51_08975 [Candidatus Eremiobacteraceae bacterium]|nr:hypothetical protein [Candidatus Eremiobacteraceae bacterium]
MMASSDVSNSGRSPSTRGERQATVLLLGFPRLAKPLLQALGDENLRCVYGRFSALRVPFCDVVYQVGGGPFVRPRIFDVCKAMRRPVIKHWVGSDVLRAREPRVVEQHATGLVEDWAVSAELVEELRHAGIAAKQFPLSALSAVDLRPMPPEPLTVLAYLPSPKFDFYGGEIVLSLAERFTDVRFLVVGTDGAGRIAPGNVTFLGHQLDMDAVYARSHVLLRLPRHDGLSFMVLEALNHGREVIWNHPFEASRLALTENEAAAQLRELRSRLRAGELTPNIAGREYVISRYSGEGARVAIRRELTKFARAATLRGSAL